MKRKYILNTEYITLGQLLKELNVISSGGMSKWYLQENSVFVDGQLENRRGRKLYPGQMVELPEEGTFFMAKNTEEDSEKDSEEQ